MRPRCWCAFGPGPRRGRGHPSHLRDERPRSSAAWIFLFCLARAVGGPRDLYRGRLVDGLVSRFLADNPAGTVVEIGAGFGSPSIASGRGRARWFEIDLPERNAAAAAVLQRGSAADVYRGLGHG